VSTRLHRGRLSWIIVVLALAISDHLCAPRTAGAAGFGPIELVSKSAHEQAEEASEPAISADGRYVAFCGVLDGHTGILREQLATHQAMLVAAEPVCRAETLHVGAPSISSDGRYVSFTTDSPLSPSDTETNSGRVYVADMSTSPPTYVLASTFDGSTPMEGNSYAADRSALSADGHRVAFVNQGNVYVRDLATHQTILISATRSRVTGAMEQEIPVAGGGAWEPAGAAISADGSTVAWVGEHLPEQVPLLGDEESAINGIEEQGQDNPSADAHYFEPLWRRIPSSSDEDPATRRIVGGGDPLAPGCTASGSVEEAQCQGPFPDSSSSRLVEQVTEQNGTGWGVKLPQLDANGETIALVGDPEEQYDLFVVNMQEGLDRLQAVRRITHWTNPVPLETGLGNLREVLRGGSLGEYLPFAGEIAGCAISPDGTRVAFSTARQHFSLPYSLITEIPSAVGRLGELYELNLETSTIERATPGPGKVVSEGPLDLFGEGKRFPPEGVSDPSFGEDGRLIAFASEAANLVAGDANEEPDVFLVESTPPSPIGQSTISPRPPQAAIQPAWRLTAAAYSLPDGRVRVVARVPGRGTLRASARAQLGTRLRSKKVAAARDRAAVARTLTLNLKLSSGHRSLAHKPGLVARVEVTFTGSGGKPLHAELQSRFLVHRKRDGKSKQGKGGRR
jgi:hypothetical protein